MENGVQGFVFASSMSVYGSGTSVRPRSEDDPAAPDDPYGASKRAIELIGEQMSRQRGMEFVALRIARVVGPGIKKTSSPWRSQIFERERSETIEVPFAPDAKLSLVHVKEVARMLIVLASTVSPRQQIYNTPADVLEAAQLKNIVETMMHSRVELGLPGCYAGPACDGTRFTTEFGFVPKKLADLLSHPTAGVENDSDPAHPLP
jgi:nucleoside-diphosphate-sugar epimerase